MKWLGMALVLVSCSLLGFVYARRFAERPRQLRWLQAGFAQLETSILYRSEDLRFSFGQIAEHLPHPVGMLFARFSALLGESDGESTYRCWEKAIEETWPHTAMQEREKEMLLQFGHNLGSSDRDDQIQHIKALTTQLQWEEKAAREEQEKYEKMSRTLGILGGLFLVILLY